MTTLNINFFNATINETQRAEFMGAVSFENADMTVQLCSDNISRLETQIANKRKSLDNATEDESITINKEVEALEAKKVDAETEKEKAENRRTEFEPIYNKVVDAMSIKNKDGFGNKKDVVRTVLRVLASWDNSKLTKYAIIPVFESPRLYEALEAIHINSKAGENGNITMSKEVKEAYKKASDELETIIKTTFSLPFETEYTSKTRVKLTAEDKKLLNDCYVRGFRNKFATDDETGVVSFKKRQINTLVKAKKDKKSGEIKYDYSALASTISAIVISHYFA